MKTALLFTFLLFLGPAIPAQSLKKYPIGNSGCSLYAYCDIKIKTEYSEDSSRVYSGECVQGGITYGVICVKLRNPVENLVMAEDLLIAYAEHLKQNFEIKKNNGYGRGHLLNDNMETRGILDYWEDAEGDKWKIKAWTDGKYIGFMYAYSRQDMPEKKTDAFLDGFRLPGM